MTQLSYRFDHWDGTRPLNLGESTFCWHPQIVYDSKNCYWAPSWFSSAGWPKPSLKAGVKSASAKIFASSAGITGNEWCCSLPTRNGVSSNDTFPFPVSVSLLSGPRFTTPVTVTLLTTLVNCIGSIKPPKKAGRPALLDLNPNFEILSQMRNLTIQFLDDDGQCTFLSFTHFGPLAYSSLSFPDCTAFCQMLSYDLTIGWIVHEDRSIINPSSLLR